MHRIPSLALCITWLWTLLAVAPAHAQPGMVLSHQKISDTQGGFDGVLADGDMFGNSLASLGDLDGDGVGDIAVGAREDDDGGSRRGAVWILFLEQDGTVKSEQKISDDLGGFEGTLDNIDRFGFSVASLGDLDGDGVNDLAVGAPNDDDGGNALGCVWVLFLNTDGTVKSHQKISDTEGGIGGLLDGEDHFGSSIGSLGDLDGDGVGDIAVGALGDDDGGTQSGAVWVLFLNSDGTVKSHQKISDTEGGFGGGVDGSDSFGSSIASLGDQDGDGVGDIAVGAKGDTQAGSGYGAVWVLFLNSDGTVKSHQKISETQGGFDGELGTDEFGFSLAALGDLDGDGVGDLAVGANHDDEGGNERGAVWVLFLEQDGTVKSHQKISDTQGGFTGVLDDNEHFGSSITSLGDLDGDGVGDIVVGAPLDDDGGNGRGAVWVLFLDGVFADCDGDSIPDVEETDTDGDGIIDDCDPCPLDNPDDTDGDGICDSDDCDPCPGDLDCDGMVGAADLAILLGAWGPCPEPPAPCPPDIHGDGDGIVRADDLATLLGSWGPCL